MNGNETILIGIKAPDKKMWMQPAYHLCHWVGGRNLGLLLNVESEAVDRLIPP
jgi:hypothetical protein